MKEQNRIAEEKKSVEEHLELLLSITQTSAL